MKPLENLYKPHGTIVEPHNALQNYHGTSKKCKKNQNIEEHQKVSQNHCETIM